MPDNDKKPWYSNGLAFDCHGCGDCCRGPGGYVWVDEDEIQSLAKELGMTVQDFGKKLLRRTSTGYALVDSPTGDCPLLDSAGRCRVYHARPVQCRTWPWWDENLSSPLAWADAATRCPGMNKGEVHSLFVIQNELAKKF